ncbi:MAG: hypothetical protein ACD_75C02555G0001 [uncultured bacterium]|nr:MAG: hypothetical protein ACD_75C02555G0001 [uncultured bacterium]
MGQEVHRHQSGFADHVPGRETKGRDEQGEQQVSPFPRHPPASRAVRDYGPPLSDLSEQSDISGRLAQAKHF